GLALLGRVHLDVDRLALARPGRDQRGDDDQRGRLARVVEQLADVGVALLLEAVLEHRPPGAGRRAAAGPLEAVDQPDPADGDRVGVADGRLVAEGGERVRVAGRVLADLGPDLPLVA